jgi:hypothetical protein
MTNPMETVRKMKEKGYEVVAETSFFVIMRRNVNDLDEEIVVQMTTGRITRG